MIRKLSSGKYRLYSKKKDPKTKKRRNLGTFNSLSAAKKHERDIHYFKRAWIFLPVIHNCFITKKQLGLFQLPFGNSKSSWAVAEEDFVLPISLFVFNRIYFKPGSLRIFIIDLYWIISLNPGFIPVHGWIWFDNRYRVFD